MIEKKRLKDEFRMVLKEAKNLVTVEKIIVLIKTISARHRTAPILNFVIEILMDIKPCANGYFN